MKPIALAATLAAFATGAVAAEWTMPTPYPDGNFHTENIKTFAEEVREATGGEVDITVHPAGSLVKHPEIKNAVRSGQAQAGEFLLSLISNENPVFGIDAVPFLATSYADAETLWEASKAETEALLERQNLMVLFAVPWPPQGLYANTPVETAEDMAGMRFRAYNAATERLAQLAGAVPTQIEVPDIPQAFATGRIDAMVTSSSTGVNSKAWDFLTHFYDTQAWLPKNVTVVNRDAFEALDAASQEAVLEAAAAAQERGWAASQAEHEAQMEVLAENGVTVGPPSEALTTSLREIGATMSEEWKSEAGSEGQAILDAYGR